MNYPFQLCTNRNECCLTSSCMSARIHSSSPRDCAWTWTRSGGWTNPCCGETSQESRENTSDQQDTQWATHQGKDETLFSFLPFFFRCFSVISSRLHHVPGTCTINKWTHVSGKLSMWKGCGWQAKDRFVVLHKGAYHKVHMLGHVGVCRE